jgi:CrcB protein
MKGLMLVALGGALGATCRHLVTIAAIRLFGAAFPGGTLMVNLTGCLAMGIFAELITRRLDFPEELRLFVATGLLGGFTTFSAFSLDAVMLWERGAAGSALGYVAVSVAGSIAALFVGLWLARNLV